MPHAARRIPVRPRKRPLQERSRATVDAILTAATHVFSAQGYAGATTNKVAERAGVSIGSLYQYFPNKDALLAALIDAHVREGETLLTKAAAEGITAGEGLPSVVRRLVRAMVEFHARDRALHRVLFEEAPLPRSVRRRIEEIEAQVTGLVAQYLVRAAHPPPPDPALAAAIVVQTVEGLTHRLVVYGHDDVSVERWVEEISTLVVRYLAAPRAHGS